MATRTLDINREVCHICVQAAKLSEWPNMTLRWINQWCEFVFWKCNIFAINCIYN